MFRFRVLGRPGDVLLSHTLRCSTIGAEGLNGRVRNGIGCFPLAITTRSTQHAKPKRLTVSFIKNPGDVEMRCLLYRACRYARRSNQANRAISTGKLHALLRFHTRPINVVVFHGSQGRTRFEVGFPLRCLQRLSIPYIATLLCGWRHNRSTRDTSIPVLSY